MAKKNSTTGVFGRSVKMASMATRLVSKEITSQLKTSLSKKIDTIQNEEVKKRIAQAKILTSSLGELKGAAMKAGQLLSLDASDFFPPEAKQILSQLQSKATLHPFGEIEQILKTELGDKFSELSKINPVPLASASIGQVHKACYQGEEIVLKVQYPGIEESIDSDLGILNKIVSGLISVTGKKMDLTSTFDELKFVLKLEANYLNEIKNLKKVNKLLENSKKYTCPEPFEEISTQKVLAMSFKEGVSINKWAESASDTEKHAYGADFLNLFIEEFLKWKLVQTDPNFANFLIDTKESKIILLDFGACLSYTDEFIVEYKKLLTLAYQDKKDELFEQSVKFGLIDARESEKVKDLFCKMMYMSVEPFLAENQPFNFSDPEYEKRSRKIIFEFTNGLIYSPPPRKIIFLHRKLGGLFNLLKKIDVQLDLSPFWDKILKS